MLQPGIQLAPAADFLLFLVVEKWNWWKQRPNRRHF